MDQIIRQDQWFRALAVLDTQGFQADLVTFTSIASSCAKALQWQADVALLSSLQNSATEIDAWISQGKNHVESYVESQKCGAAIKSHLCVTGTCGTGLMASTKP